MGSLRLTVRTAILAAAVVAAAPAARAADGGGSVAVTPASPAPGADLTVRTEGCAGEQGTAASAAFVSDARLTGGQGTLTGDTRVRSGLEPGAYAVKVVCGERVITGSLTVGGPDGARSAAPVAPVTAAASPVAPVAAGGGGTAHFATVATSGSGPDTGQAVTGLALAGLAALAVGLRARRARSTR
ncbi:hypothetical protein AB0E62_05575 [Streptomyces sp. NPDC038707]|uniref:hypothetical protein n=1 Tax=unclassified Streptomyces TaxID=2593676 RepID=UPI0034030D7E